MSQWVNSQPPDNRVQFGRDLICRAYRRKEPDMETRLDPRKAAPEVYRAMFALEAAVKATGMEKNLLDLVKLRVSQINGWEFFIDMHSKDLRAEGENEERLYLLDAWRGAFLLRPRAGRVGVGPSSDIDCTFARPDDVYQEARQQFSEDELTKLTLAVVAINGWNRFGIAFRAVPGKYQPVQRHEAAMT